MVFWAVAVVLVGIVLKAIAAEPGSAILLPLAAIAGFYHVSVHRAAARSPAPSAGLAAISDIAMLGALLMQIDYGPYHCGHTTIDGISWIFGWSAEKRCTLIRGGARGHAGCKFLHPGGGHVDDAESAVPASPVLMI
jgi:hypothetical protein